MSLETTVQSLVNSTTSLLVAVNNRKTLLDAAQESASASATAASQSAAQAALGPTFEQVIAALGVTPASKAGDTFTGNVFVNAGADSRFLVQVAGVTQGQFQANASAVRLASNNAISLALSTNGVDRVTLDSVGNLTFGSASASGVFKVQGLNAGDLVVFESTDASATAAPDFVLFRNSASPAAADQIANILFRGKTRLRTSCFAARTAPGPTRTTRAFCRRSSVRRPGPPWVTCGLAFRQPPGSTTC
jgi:hypothetical protein